MHKLYSVIMFVLIGFISISSSAQQNTFRPMREQVDYWWDDFGWRLSGSVGTVLFETIDVTFEDEIPFADKNIVVPRTIYKIPSDQDIHSVILKETLFPSLTLRLESKPYKGLAADFEVAYFMHEIDGPDSSWKYQACPSPPDSTSCQEKNGTFEGDRNNFVAVIGGNYYFDNSSFFVPYLQADVGISNSFITLNFKDTNSADVDVANDFQIIPLMQGGAGFDTNLGPLSIGVAYKYIFLGDQSFEYDIITSGDEQGEIHFGNVGGHGFELKIGTTGSIF